MTLKNRSREVSLFLAECTRQRAQRDEQDNNCYGCKQMFFQPRLLFFSVCLCCNHVVMNKELKDICEAAETYSGLLLWMWKCQQIFTSFFAASALVGSCRVREQQVIAWEEGKTWTGCERQSHIQRQTCHCVQTAHGCFWTMEWRPENSHLK